MLEYDQEPGRVRQISKDVERWLHTGFDLLLDDLGEAIDSLSDGRKPDAAFLWDDLPPSARPSMNAEFLARLSQTAAKVRAKVFDQTAARLHSRDEEVVLFLAVEAAKGGDENADEDALDEYFEDAGDLDSVLWDDVAGG